MAKQKHANKIEQIILFCSYARGEAMEESDIDLLIVCDITLDELIDISSPMLLKYSVCISPHVITASHLSFLEKEGYGFIKNVKKEGKSSIPEYEDYITRAEESLSSAQILLENEKFNSA